jgi:D-beta-D-heptose 7-phosphate kinase / D-beta-D-heptose 1-phosphate adenosyltransferase
VSDGHPLVVVGDALLDRDVDGRVERLAPDAPVPVVDEVGVRVRPGGAGLAAALALADGRLVTLVTALALDASGDELRAALARSGVDVVDLGLDGTTPEKIRITSGGRSLLRLDRGGDVTAIGSLTAAARAAIGWAAAVLVADYGRGVAAQPDVREAVQAAAGDVPLIWDPHPRGPAPVPGATMATPSLAEAVALEPEPAGSAVPAIAARAAVLAARWHAREVCITCGARGAVVAAPGGHSYSVPAQAIRGGDPCGAGDRFASRLAGALADGDDSADAVAAAVNAATRFVAAGGALADAAGTRPSAVRSTAGGGAKAGTGPVSPAVRSTGAGTARAGGAGRVEGLLAAVRARGGTVVATGGCFDLLHPGHIRTLQAARALGDCLVVCLNSDASVRRLKGPGRPIVGEDDRAAVLRALGCVDEVVTFGEDTPEAILERLRPDVWAKGGDYAAEDLPEARALARWGAKVVLLPFLEGRSTTRLLEEVAIRAV